MKLKTTVQCGLLASMSIYGGRGCSGGGGYTLQTTYLVP